MRTIMLLITFLLVAILPLLAADTVKDATYLTALEKDIVRELNLVRTNPKAYAEQFIKPCVLYPSADVKECYTDMIKTKAMGLLSPSLGMTEAARYHVRDQSVTGAVGHSSSDGKTFDKRLDLFGKWSGAIAENISYGEDTAQGIVIQLLVDSGVSSKGHRRNILNPNYLLIGVATGPHAEYGVMCVQDFGAKYVDKASLTPSASQSIDGEDSAISTDTTRDNEDDDDDEWDF